MTEIITQHNHRHESTTQRIDDSAAETNSTEDTFSSGSDFSSFEASDNHLRDEQGNSCNNISSSKNSSIHSSSPSKRRSQRILTRRVVTQSTVQGHDQKSTIFHNYKDHHRHRQETDTDASIDNLMIEEEEKFLAEAERDADNQQTVTEETTPINSDPDQPVSGIQEPNTIDSDSVNISTDIQEPKDFNSQITDVHDASNQDLEIATETSNKPSLQNQDSTAHQSISPDASEAEKLKDSDTQNNTTSAAISIKEDIDPPIIVATSSSSPNKKIFSSTTTTTTSSTLLSTNSTTRKRPRSSNNGLKGGGKLNGPVKSYPNTRSRRTNIQPSLPVPNPILMSSPTKDILHVNMKQEEHVASTINTYPTTSTNLVDTSKTVISTTGALKNVQQPCSNPSSMKVDHDPPLMTPNNLKPTTDSSRLFQDQNSVMIPIKQEKVELLDLSAVTTPKTTNTSLESTNTVVIANGASVCTDKLSFPPLPQLATSATGNDVHTAKGGSTVIKEISGSTLVLSSDTNQPQNTPSTSLPQRRRIFSIDLDPEGFDFEYSMEVTCSSPTIEYSEETTNILPPISTNPNGRRSDEGESEGPVHIYASYANRADACITSNICSRDRGMSFELFSFGVTEDDALNSISSDNYNSINDANYNIYNSCRSSFIEKRDQTHMIGGRPRGDSIIFDPVSFSEGGIHEEKALSRSRHNSLALDEYDEIKLMNEPGLLSVSALNLYNGINNSNQNQVLHVNYSINPVPNPVSAHPSNVAQSSSPTFKSNRTMKASARSLSKRGNETNSQQQRSTTSRSKSEVNSAVVSPISNTKTQIASSSYYTDDSFHRQQNGDICVSMNPNVPTPHILPSSLNGTICPTTCPMDLLNKGGRIGIYLPEARKERIAKFHSKRKMRIWRKRIKYDCRKKLADSRPRIKGRFVKSLDLDDEE